MLRSVDLTYEAFIKECEEAEVILKVEKTVEPPPISLLEKSMKIVDGDADVVELKKQIMPYPPVDSRLPEVVLLFAALPPFLSLLF